MQPSPAPLRSRTRGACTGTGPRPVMITRSGRCPWRTSRWRPSSVCLSAWPARKAATSASTACANSARAPARRTSVSGSENSAGWISLTTLSWIIAYHSFAGEVEASNTPTIRRLTPSRRHQLPRIAGWKHADYPAGRWHQTPPAGRHCRRANPLDRVQTAQGGIMALTRSFKETVKARAERDPAFRDALLTEAVDQFLAGDLNTGKGGLGGYINTPTHLYRVGTQN